jgi:heptaprenyl diphosphate synthase
LPGSHALAQEEVPQIAEERRRIIAVLGAFCVFLSTIEYLIPKPVPFFRLGLANLPLLLALKLPFTAFITLAAVKIVASALFQGSLFSQAFLFSCAGTAASALVMWGLGRVPARLISRAGIGAAGALFSNAAQILLARFFILGKGAFFIAPPLLLMGTLTGIALGVFAEHFSRRSLWCRAVLENETGLPAPSTPPPAPREAVCAQPEGAARALLSLIPPLVLSLLILFIPGTISRLALCALFWLIAAFRGRAGNALFTLLFFLGIVLCNLLTPYGRVIASAGPFLLTEGALLTGLSKAAAVEGLLLISRTFIPRNLTLPGRFGRLVAEVFAILALLGREKERLPLRGFNAKLDALLWKCWRAAGEKSASGVTG